MVDEAGVGHDAAMSDLEGPIDRLLWTIGRAASGFVISLIAGALYVGLGLAVPLILGWSTGWPVAANVTGTTLAALVVLFWFAARFQARDRRLLVEWTSDLRLLDSREFEWFVGELLRREGWKVEEVGRHGVPDGGIDLLIERGKERKVVQCKRWESWSVGVEKVRSFAGTLSRDGRKGSDGIFVTLSDFTEAARTEAELMGMTLWDNVALHARAEKVRRTERCPECSQSMVLYRSPHGWWFRCTAGGCRGKRDLGRDAGRAVALLMESPE